jgi:hypothetical protein
MVIVSKNRVEEKRLYRLSADQGCESAKSALRKMWL